MRRNIDEIAFNTLGQCACRAGRGSRQAKMAALSLAVLDLLVDRQRLNVGQGISAFYARFHGEPWLVSKRIALAAIY